MENNKVILCKCPICGKDARTIDSAKKFPSNLRKCDENETYKCYNDKDDKSLRYVARQKYERVIDWSQVEGGEK